VRLHEVGLARYLALDVDYVLLYKLHIRARALWIELVTLGVTVRIIPRQDRY